MNTSDMTTKLVYGFTLHPERIYGTVLTDMTFLGRIDADLVTAYGIVPEEEHAKVYSTLPSGVPDSASQYPWLIFRALNGSIIVVGEPWIVADSVTGGTQEDVWDVTGILGDSSTPAKIKSALSAIGIYTYTVKKRS